LADVTVFGKCTSRVSARGGCLAVAAPATTGDTRHYSAPRTTAFGCICSQNSHGRSSCLGMRCAAIGPRVISPSNSGGPCRFGDKLAKGPPDAPFEALSAHCALVAASPNSPSRARLPSRALLLIAPSRIRRNRLTGRAFDAVALQSLTPAAKRQVPRIRNLSNASILGPPTTSVTNLQYENGVPSQSQFPISTCFCIRYPAHVPTTDIQPTKRTTWTPRRKPQWRSKR
jgi:hypothetical protein